MSLVCIPVAVESVEQALEAARDAGIRGADLIEYRVDGYFSGTDITQAAATTAEIIERSPLPSILTCRLADEGGHYDGSEADRLAFLEAVCLASAPAFVDFELASYTASANVRQKLGLILESENRPRKAATRLLLSMHDFRGRPADLLRRVATASTCESAAAVKVAIHGRSIRDSLELFEMMVEAPRPMAAMAMGEAGEFSRILAPKFGSFLAFASLRSGSETAPGQIPLADLLNVYRFRSISATTGVLGIVGERVEHSLSPTMQNAAFEAIGADLVYAPLPVAPSYESFKATMLEFINHPLLDFCGCSVTIPHKENLARLALEGVHNDPGMWEVDGLTRLCGAANTLIVRRKPFRSTRGSSVASCVVRNTDGPAAVACLEDAVGAGRPLRCAVLGAGGTARAVSASLVLSGHHVVVFNRSERSAMDMIERLREVPTGNGRGSTSFGGEAFSPTPAGEKLDALINCTPVGMSGGPAPDQSLVDVTQLRSAAVRPVVFETVYAPRETPLLRYAREAGCAVIEGSSLLVRQGIMQFESWTGQRAPRALMEQTVMEALATREREAG